MQANNLRPFHYLALYFLFLMLFAWMVHGCSAEYHVKKAIKKGYEINVKIDTVKIPYLVNVKIKGKDTTLIQYRDSLIIQTQTEYLTRWKVRFDYKRFSDSLDQIRAMYADSLRNALRMQKTAVKRDIKIKRQETKTIQSENKNGFADSVKWIAVVLVLLIIAYLLFKYSPKTPEK